MPTNELVKGFTINDEQHLIDVSSLDGEITETVLFDRTIDCQNECDEDLNGNILYRGSFESETPIDTFQLSNGDCVNIYIDGTSYISYCFGYEGNGSYGDYRLDLGNLVFVIFGWHKDGEDNRYNHAELLNVSQGTHTLKISKINQSRLPSNLVPKSLDYGNEQEIILTSVIKSFSGSDMQ